MLGIGHVKGIVESVGKGVNQGAGESLGKVKVRLPEYDNLVTDWLPVLQGATLGAKCHIVPRAGTQVIVLPGQGLEDALVIGSIFSQPNPSPFGGRGKEEAMIGMVADDGTEISYDPGKSILCIKSPKEINITATKFNLVGDMDIKGDIRHSGDSDQTGKARLTGDMKHVGDLETNKAVIGGINFATHRHSGVMSGSATSGQPAG